jgi:anaerobic selenocysteine-containing dehydrogenase
LFLSETANHAHLVLPATSWLEEIGYKVTNTHVYLMDQAIEPVGQARPLSGVLKELAQRLGLLVFNDRGEAQARARITEGIVPGIVWMRQGWPHLNALTTCAPCLPDSAVEGVGFPAGQAAHEALVEVAKLTEGEKDMTVPCR